MPALFGIAATLYIVAGQASPERVRALADYDAARQRASQAKAAEEAALSRLNSLPESGSHTSNRRHYISSAITLWANRSFTEVYNGLEALIDSPFSARYRRLPVVDIGTHDGSDCTIPAAKQGHRVYSYEPTPLLYDRLVRTFTRKGVAHVRKLDGFRKAPPGHVLLRKAVACSDKEGFAQFTVAPKALVGNSLNADAIPKFMTTGATQVNVTLRTLNEDLKAEDKGVFLLKIDAQGHEYHILRGGAEYIKTHPVYIIFLEYFPKGLLAHKVDPKDLLMFLTDELGYTCFDPRYQGAASRTFDQFIADNFRKKGPSWGLFTDLACFRFDLL